MTPFRPRRPNRGNAAPPGERRNNNPRHRLASPRPQSQPQNGGAHPNHHSQVGKEWVWENPDEQTLPMTFPELGLSPELLAAISAEGYERPTPIQAQAIPHILKGRDLLGCAQTGTGKTAAFVLPILQRLARGERRGKVRALIITPTRELAVQIGERVGAYGAQNGLRHAVIYGGVGDRAQKRAMNPKPDIIVATPGRLMDLMRGGHLHLDGIETLVLDEADRMLDMGFIVDVKRIVSAIPKERQTLLFSATMPTSIRALADGLLRDPARVSITPKAPAAETVKQSVYFVAKAEKKALLIRLLNTLGIERAIIFMRTKHGASRLCDQLNKGGIDALAIHGDKSQGQRQRALEEFRAGTTLILVATDVAARGIDVNGISHVFNYDLPNQPDSYVHRIGRTGRAGAAGIAVSFCDRDERPFLADIERFIQAKIPVAGGDETPTTLEPSPDVPEPANQSGQRSRRYRGVRLR